jgi:hypothetical protein
VGISELAFPLAASDLAIAGISAGAALVGGVLGALAGGWVTYGVEKSRQKAARKLEKERYEREQEVRKRQDLDVARGLARVLSEEFMLGAAHAASEREAEKWGPVRPMPRLIAEDRKELFRHLSAEEFFDVIAAQSALANLAFSRDAFLAAAAEEHPPYTAGTSDFVEDSMVRAGRGIEALNRLARQ